MRKLTVGIVSAVALMGLGMASAQADDRGGRVGIIKCTQIGSKTNLLIHSVAKFECVFERGGEKELYNGEAGVGLGLDLQWDKAKTIGFSVLSAVTDYRMGSYALEGTYVGGKASVSVGVGTGAQVLVGGGSENVSLQPLALEGSEGAGAGAGVGYLSLKRK